MVFARISLNGSSRYKELIQYQLELSFGFSSPGLCSGDEFYLVYRPDRLLFRIEPLSHNTCREWSSCCLCKFWLDGLCSIVDSNSSRRSQAYPLSTTHSCYGPSLLERYTIYADTSKRRANRVSIAMPLGW